MKEATARSGTRTRFRQIAGFFHLLLTEYRRAIAAAALHEDLRRMNAVARTRENIACSEIPRRVFAAFYSSGGPVRKAAAWHTPSLQILRDRFPRAQSLAIPTRTKPGRSPLSASTSLPATQMIRRRSTRPWPALTPRFA